MIRPFTTGSDYVNQIGSRADEGSKRIRGAFGVNDGQLVVLRNTYDPANLLRIAGILSRQCRDHASSGARNTQ
jgi:hypothetical protein